MLTFEVKNIGLVKEAIIEVGGLTVLTGENDTGKSTVCKAIFSLLKFVWFPNGILEREIEKKPFLFEYSKTQPDLGLSILLGGLIFKNQIHNFKNKKIAELNIKNILDIKIIDEMATLQIKKADFASDATYIESPLIIQQFQFIKNSLIDLNNRLMGKKAGITDLPLWVQDFVVKLNLNARVKFEIESNIQKVYDYITKVINGEVAYNEGKDDFMFKKQDIKESIEMTNTATGIKSFGLLQSLIQASAISSQSVLIIDEPEVHLHPKWQLEYVKVLVKLAEVGVPVIVSSHSPYMIRALKTYAHKSEIKDQTKFYYAEMTDEGSIFNDCSDDLDPIFTALAIPMSQLDIDE